MTAVAGGECSPAPLARLHSNAKCDWQGLYFGVLCPCVSTAAQCAALWWCLKCCAGGAFACHASPFSPVLLKTLSCRMRCCCCCVCQVQLAQLLQDVARACAGGAQPCCHSTTTGGHDRRRSHCRRTGGEAHCAWQALNTIALLYISVC
jgi:hypothetical protein